MIQHVLKEVGGIGMYGVVSVCLFFVIFAGTLFWAFGLKKSFLSSMSALPLEDEEAVSRKRGCGGTEKIAEEVQQRPPPHAGGYDLRS